VSEQTFFWYDLETSGINPREDRVMQFAGQRTDLHLEPIGEPVNILIRLNEDILPEPDAVLLTGITPQQTLADGVTELEFLQVFYDIVATEGTIFVGFNSIRFDDEFMRYLNYRNFYDPYEWQWKGGRSRWDLLDVVRMTRALRPEGLQWPIVDGKPGNRLEMLTKANGIEHSNAHDALADVTASIALARLIQTHQPKLFQWLLEYRDKSKVKQLVESKEPFVYSSGKYDAEFDKTTVAVQLCEHPKKQGSLVYDLRYDPTPFLDMDTKTLAERWRWTREPNAPARLPVKTMQYNRCPAVAPLSVLDAASQDRIQLRHETAAANHKTLLKHPEFVAAVHGALAILDAEQNTRQKTSKHAVDARLYDGFFDSHDGNLLGVVRAAKPQELTPKLAARFHDERLRDLFPLFKARNYPRSLTDEERTAWEAHRHHILLDGGENSRLSKFMHRMGECIQENPTTEQQYLLEELQLYAESIFPSLEG